MPGYGHTRGCTRPHRPPGWSRPTAGISLAATAGGANHDQTRAGGTAATDLDRAAAFFTDLLGAEPTGRFDPPGLLFFDLNGTRLLLEGNAPASMLYLEVEDVRRAVEALRGRTEVITEPHVIFSHEDDTLGPAGTTEWQAFVTDSEGNTVGLVSFEATA